MSANIWDQRTFKVLFVMVTALAGPALWSWFSPVEAVHLKASKAKAARGLASVGPQSDDKSGKLSRPVTLDWNTTQNSFSKDVEGTHLRLKGELVGMKLSTVVNVSNGFTASVFETGPSFTTDFIELKEGPNHLEVELTDGKGKKVTKKIEINRRQPAGL